MAKTQRRFSIISHSAHDAIKAWHRQYGFDSRLLADRSNSGEISKKLHALKKPTKKQVMAIIGPYEGWVTVLCSSCHEYHPKVASFGDDSSVEVCEACLRAALQQLVKTRVLP